MKNCRKKPFHSRSSARRFKRHIKQTFGTQSSIYKCRSGCGNIYHLTTMDRDMQRQVIYGISGLFNGPPEGADTEEANKYPPEQAWPVPECGPIAPCVEEEADDI